MNRKVLITGGTGSLGRCLVEKFYEEGYDVYFQYNLNENMAEKMKIMYPSTLGIKLDFQQEFNPEVLGEFDILVNNAAYCNPESITENIENDVWNKVFRINLTVPFMLSKYILPKMKKKQWGRIINISSIYGLRPIETLVPYSSSKAGLIGMTKGIAKEYASHGITCNVVCPGTIDSDLMRKIGIAYCNETGDKLDDYIQGLCDEVPMKRLAKPEDIASMVLYLASNSAEYITGETITIDGGSII